MTIPRIVVRQPVAVRARRAGRAFAIAISMALLGVPAAHAADLNGTVRLTLDGQRLPSHRSQDAVVYFRADVPVPVPVPDAPLVMKTENKSFLPRSLAIPMGAEVAFPNFDPILHNVFSASRRHEFDLGLYGESEVRQQRFSEAGLVRVYCNVHHDMVGHILVLDTPFVASPGPMGEFVLRDAGGRSGELYVWHEQARLVRQRIEVADEPTLNFDVELSRPRVPAHSNKFGRPYGTGRDGRY